MQRQAVGREALQTFPEWTVLFSHDKIHYDCVGPPTGTQFSLKRCQMNNKTTRYKVSPTLTHSSLCPRPDFSVGIQQTDGAASATAAVMGWCLLRHSSLRTPNTLP